ncbi:MAG: hypothetical protein Q7S27_06560 [Nanoarchaeota archaeon]|nr:hypothetical protein [Nanoarchaeota archaeon]
MAPSLGKILGEIGLNIGLEVRNTINGLNYKERADICPSILKGEKTKNVDAIGEKISIKSLEALSEELSIPIRLIIEPTKNSFYDIGSLKGEDKMNVYLDPVDGTIKLAGLGNSQDVLRMVNDGVWGFGISFTMPTKKPIEDLQIKDFIYSAIVDGNPSLHNVFPTNAFTKNPNRKIMTYEKLENKKFNYQKNEHVLLTTSTQENLAQGIIGYDAFQGFDRNSAPRETEELALKVYKKLSNRNEGGAFDLWRIYGEFGDILRTQLGYKELEPQGVGRVILNNHLGNAIPTYSILIGAGASIVDFSGRDIGERKINEGRTNMICAANPGIERKILDLINS